ncbi:S8 family serine peptidase [Dyella flava]|uniref:S8 family serine peptidase n=1 Tax=Dyella flava TaxID=1920170 RepID=A0ABS2K159_9GAMM|nr:S8 family serine peptidase [Dyella flava]MBM7124987.1 S8 family serine peptidase [Dyella flava]GLQ49941.1 serine protease [Dyella flava]
MKHGFFLSIALAALLSACAHSPSEAPQDPPSDVGHASAPDISAMDPQRDIVLAVANPIEPPSTHAGSSLLGYTPHALYGAGERAVSNLAALKQQYGLHEVAGWPIKALQVYCVVLEPPAGVARDSVIKALAKDDRVQLVQPLQDYAVYSDNAQDAHPYNDPYVNLQRGFVETDAAIAQNTSQGAGVHIAIVDTGADTMHPDLRGRISDTHNEVDDNASSFNRDSHGTEVAGIIAADGDNHRGIVGIAPQSIVSIYKACWYSQLPNSGARCNSFTLAKALAAIIDTNARIINLSLGGPADPLLGKLLDHLLSQGRIVVAALPPSGAVDGFPDNAPGVIVVRTSSASPAPPGVLSAPGNDILTTQPGGGYDFTSGSSMAAAHVSGIAALLLSLSPRLDARTVHDLLLRSSKTSHGVLQVNAAAAVTALGHMQKTNR